VRVEIASGSTTQPVSIWLNTDRARILLRKCFGGQAVRLPDVAACSEVGSSAALEVDCQMRTAPGPVFLKIVCMGTPGYRLAGSGPP